MNYTQTITPHGGFDELETMKNNKLITEFMGNEWHQEFFQDVFIISPSNITYKFDTDWNWLMPVVEKIESLGNDVLITTNYIQIAFDNGEKFIVIKDVNIKIKAVYSAVVEFIKISQND